MLFPGSRIWYEGSANDLAALTEEIKTSHFSGHIVLEFHDSLDIVIISGGDFLKVIEKIGQRLVATKKYREIWGKCQIKPGRMFVFELPPALSRRLKGMNQRRLLSSGRLGEGCDLEKIIRHQKAARLDGFLDCVAPEGKALLEFETGTITSCYYTEYQGLFYTGLEGFRRWHQSLVRAKEPFYTFVSEYVSGVDNSQAWDEILIDNVENIKGPLLSSSERLFAAFGKRVPEDERIFQEGQYPGQAFIVLEGGIELSRKSKRGPEVLGILGQGEILGLSWLFGVSPAPLTGRALRESRLLAFDQTELEHLVYNSPSLASQIVWKLTRLLQAGRRRLQVFQASPQLKDLESYIIRVVNRNRKRLEEGFPPGELYRELSQIAPFSLPEIDIMFRELISIGRIEITGGRVKFQPEEI
jgi:CRP-like cAMP-binding protein